MSEANKQFQNKNKKEGQKGKISKYITLTSKRTEKDDNPV